MLKSNSIKKKTNQNNLLDNPSNIEIAKVYELKPSDISMKEQYLLFFKWIASQFQVIKDFKIVDYLVRLILLTNFLIYSFIEWTKYMAENIPSRKWNSNIQS